MIRRNMRDEPQGAIQKRIPAPGVMEKPGEPLAGAGQIVWAPGILHDITSITYVNCAVNDIIIRLGYER